jgi:putative endonuclease
VDRFFVYVLVSERDRQVYIGMTEDVERRVQRHNDGKVKSTKSRIPFALVHQEHFSDRSTARKREKFFKSGIGRKVLKSILARVVELADTPA